MRKTQQDNLMKSSWEWIGEDCFLYRMFQKGLSKVLLYSHPQYLLWWELLLSEMVRECFSEEVY
jgi:hypothetical protein